MRLLEGKDQNYLGIYLCRDSATVVCLGLEGSKTNVLGCFSVSIEEPGMQKPAELARLVAEGCASRQLQFSEAVVALDCSMFMQHNVHSAFSDPKQVAATIRFDAEEALAMDITELAIAFKIISTDQTGSQLGVFTTQRKVLSDILLSLQSNNIDPVAIEPDVNCLSRYILQNVSFAGDSHRLFCVLSRRNGYFISFADSRQSSAVRTFLVSSAQDRTELLAREVPVTVALAGTDEPISEIKAFDSSSCASYEHLGEQFGIEAGLVDLAGAAGVGEEALGALTDPVDFVIAYGAALCVAKKCESVNFRSYFMPYQGRKVRLQKAVKLLSIAVGVLILAVGLYFQMQLFQKNRYRKQLRAKFERQYSAVMFGEVPPKSNPAQKLARELRRIRDVKSGQLSVTGEESVSAKLTLVLEAFNKCAAQTNLNIDSISITTKTISITGETSSRRNTLKLFEAIESGKLDVLTQRLDAKGGRDNFRITVAPRG